MPKVAYDKDGNRVTFEFDADARDAVKNAGYTWEAPEGAEEEQESEPLTAEDMKKVADIEQRARLGGPVTPEERDLLNRKPGRDARLGEKGAVHEVGSYPEGEHPGALGGAATSPDSVPGSPPGGLSGAVANAGSPGAPVTSEEQQQEVEPQEKADTFNPATADRSELIEYLRSQGEDIPDARVGSTDELRQRVYSKMGASE